MSVSAYVRTVRCVRILLSMRKVPSGLYELYATVHCRTIRGSVYDPSAIRGSDTDRFPSASVTVIPLMFRQMIRIKYGILSVRYSGNLLRKMSGKISGFFYGKITRLISGFYRTLLYGFFPDFFHRLFPYFSRKLSAVRKTVSGRECPDGTFGSPGIFPGIPADLFPRSITKKSEGFPLRIF